MEPLLLPLDYSLVRFRKLKAVNARADLSIRAGTRIFIDYSTTKIVYNDLKSLSESFGYNLNAKPFRCR